MPTRLTYAILLSILSVHLCRSISAHESPYSTPGESKVIVVETIKLEDKKRGKNIETLVRYPDGVGPFPIIIFSHGSLSNKEAFGPASEHWASHGYVVIHPNHTDARNSITTGGMSQSRFGGAGGNSGRVERIKDVTSVLDALNQVETQIPALKGKLNRDAVAVAGHSFGAYVAQCHGGVKTLVDGKLQNLSDPRVKCVVPISAQGESQSYGLTAESWTDANTPAMHITGTRDRSAPDRPGGQFGDVTTKVVPFDRSPHGGKYLLIIEGATHISFGGRLGRMQSSRMRSDADAASLTKSISLAFLEAYLKQDLDAKAWLDGQHSAAWLGSQAKLQRKL